MIVPAATGPRLARRVVVLGGMGLLAACARLGPVSKGTGGPVVALDVNQAEASTLVTDYRRGHGLTAVVRDPQLQRAAQAQADAMATANELSHTVAGALPDRLAGLGRARGASIENVSAGYADLQAALAGWRRSPHHNENLLYAPMRRIGVAAATAPGTRYKTFWSLIMTD